MSFLYFVLLGSRPPCQGVEFATMEYWVRLRVPMDQAIRLYRVSMFVVMLCGFMPVTVFQADNTFCSVLGAYQGAWLHELRSVQSA